MNNLDIKEFKSLKPSEALKALNEFSELTWERSPKSLLPNGLIINGNNFKLIQRIK